MQQYFKMDVKSTRLNWYKTGDDWKPYHHDAAAIKEDIEIMKKKYGEHI